MEIDGDFVSRTITIRTFSFKIDLRKAIIVLKQLVVIKLFKPRKLVIVASDFKGNKLT